MADTKLKTLVKDLRSEWDIRSWAREKMQLAADAIEASQRQIDELLTVSSDAASGNVELLDRVKALNAENFALQNQIAALTTGNPK